MAASGGRKNIRATLQRLHSVPHYFGRLTDGTAPSGVQILSQAEAMLFSPTLQRLQDMSLWSLTDGRLWRPKHVPCPPEASQHPLLWKLTDGTVPSGVQILSQAEAMLFSPTLQRLQDMTPLEGILASRMATCERRKSSLKAGH